MTGTEAYEIATKKARHGHKSWIVYKNRDGTWSAEVETAGAVKRAMLAVGTQGRWTVVSRFKHIQRWNDGCRILRNASVGVHPNGRI